MRFFGKNKASDADAKREEAEADMAIAARISAVVADHSPVVADGHPEAEFSRPDLERPSLEMPGLERPDLEMHGAAPVHAYAGAPALVDAVGGGHSAWQPAPPDTEHSPYPAWPAVEHPPLSALPDPIAALAELHALSQAEAAPAVPQEREAPPTAAPAAIPDWTSADALSLFVRGDAAPSVAAPQPSTVEQAPASAPAAAGASPFAMPAGGLDMDGLMQETSMRLRSLGTVNILVAGQTGVGKSTLINSVFGEQFAQAAAGRPVTQQAQWFTSDSVPLRILDTRGLEAKDYAITLNDLRFEIENCRAQKDAKDQLHLAWVCISSPSSRVQDCEVDIVRVLNKYDIPAIIVLTKDDDDEEFAQIVGQIMNERRAAYTTIVPVRALAKPKRPSAGLEDLVVATFTALPAAHRNAFAAAQKINRDLNKVAADEYVIAASSAAAAASVIPIPFADMATLAPIQASMLIGISNAFGLTLERAQIMQLITTVLGCLALSVAGGWALGSLLKFIPGPGTVIGAVLNATMAGAMTQTLGKTYIRFVYSFMETHGRVPTASEIFEIFPSFYKAGRED